MNDTWKITPLEPANLTEMVRLTKDYFGESNQDPAFHDLDQDLTAPLKAYQPPRGGFWLAEYGGHRSLGMAGVLPIAPRTCELRRLYVAPEARRRGLGRELLHRTLDFARSARYLELLAALRHDQSAALALFEHSGFKPCARFNANRQAGIFLAYKFSSEI